MLKTRRRRVAITLVALGLAGAIGFSSVAAAAGGLAPPQLRSPRRAVHAGHIKVTVYIPDPGLVIRHNVFVIIVPKRRVTDGLLDLPKRCGFRCVVTTMKHKSAHVWTYSDHFQFPGLWQDTPGKYYWQAYYYPNTGVLGVVPSRIGSFRVVG
jgi:hypothetical protein